MNLFVYSDESGVFDHKHNDLFVFGGLVFLSKEDKDITVRKYLRAERTIRRTSLIQATHEVKATAISNKNKGKLFRSLNQVHKFGAIIHEKNILPQIFEAKKSRQRFLDYVYKISVKRKLESLIQSKTIIPTAVKNLYFFVDEHTTATDGRYELQEALKQEFLYGTYNGNYSCFFPPIFPNLQSVHVNFCNSKNVTLVRASDIVANRLFYLAGHTELTETTDSGFRVTSFPEGISFNI